MERLIKIWLEKQKEQDTNYQPQGAVSICTNGYSTAWVENEDIILPF